MFFLPLFVLVKMCLFLLCFLSFEVFALQSVHCLSVNHFIDFVCNFHPYFQFTYNVSDKEVEFLDIKLSVSGERLATSVYYKDNDSHSYLRYGSSHQRSCKNSVFATEKIVL